LTRPDRTDDKAVRESRFFATVKKEKVALMMSHFLGRLRPDDERRCQGGRPNHSV